MFKYETIEHYGPFCGTGGYGTRRVVAMDKSPKRAMMKAHRMYCHDGSCTIEYVNDGGGGVPILACERMYKNNKLIYDSGWN